MSDFQPIIDVAQKAAEPNNINVELFYAAVVPVGTELKILDTRPFRDAPDRKQGTVQLREAQSLVAYVKRHESPAACLYGDVDARKITAILDDHQGDVPGWRAHRADLVLRHTTAWLRWMEHDNKLLDQTAFALHIEECLDEIVTPSGADLLELAETFQARTEVNFRSQKRLQNGQTQLEYIEQINATAGSTGQVPVPNEFELSLAPFDGGQDQKVAARLRFRIEAGKLRIGYKLNRAEDIVRAAFDEALAVVEEGTGLVAFRGIAG